MTANDIPKSFVWTKIEAEGGQSIDRILHRKELERQSVGKFWWGIGESKSEKIRQLVTAYPHPAVVFSKMRSNAHSRDHHPDGVLLWQAYHSNGGDVSLPPYVVVTSRAHASKGRLKTHHYALVCENQAGLPKSGGGILDIGSLRNYGEGGKSIGSSQITAVVQRAASSCDSMSYPVTARATLAAPYAVQLSAPRQLSAREIRLLDDASLDGKTKSDWLSVATQLRG
jgi:hypothetical protein